MDLLCFLFCLVFAMSLCASVYMCFVVTCWERADLLALVCGVYCEFVNFPLFVCFVALRPKSTAMVIAGRSVHLTTLFFFWTSLNKQLTSTSCTYFRL